jgi:hypothetical protein
VRTRPLVFTVLLASVACRDTARSGAAASIDIVPVVELHGVGDTIDLGHGTPARSSAGLLAAPLLDPPAGGVGLFDAAGRFLARVGRRGHGPGEFQSVEAIAFGPGDSLWVFDNLFLAHVFAPPPTPTFVRTVHFATPVAASALSSEGILSPGIMWTRGARPWQPARLLDWDGGVRAEYGANARLPLIEDRIGPIVFADSNAVWSARFYEYRIDVLGADGTERRHIAREVPWFPRDTTSPGMPWIARPRPRISALARSADGMLWVLIRRAHRDWASRKANLPALTGPVRPQQLPSAAMLFEAVVEVFDVNTGRLIATRELDGDAAGFTTGGLLYERVEDDAGTATMRLSKLSVRR